MGIDCPGYALRVQHSRTECRSPMWVSPGLYSSLECVNPIECRILNVIFYLLDLFSSFANDITMEVLFNFNFFGDLSNEIVGMLFDHSNGLIDTITRTLDLDSIRDFFTFLKANFELSKTFEFFKNTFGGRGKEIWTPPHSEEILLMSSALLAVKFLWYCSGTTTSFSSIEANSATFLSRIAFAFFTPSSVPKMVIISCLSSFAPKLLVLRTSRIT